MNKPMNRKKPDKETASTSMHLRISTTAVVYVATSTCILKPGTYEWYAIAKNS